MTSSAAQSLGLLFARVPLGLYFGISGYNKIVATGGVTAFVNENLVSAMRFFPEHVARGYLTALPFAELLVAALLLFGLFQRIGAFLAAATLVIFTLTTGVKWMQGPPFNQSIIFLGLTLVLLTMGPGKLSADGLLFSKKPAAKPA